MSLMKLQKLIDSGEELTYRDKIAIIKSFEEKHGQYEIVVNLDGKPTIFTKQNEGSISLWLDSLTKTEKIEEVETRLITTKLPANKIRNQLPDLYMENKDVMVNLSKMLLEDIEKVRKDPNYVPQAKQVCNSINTIVNITKLQVQLLNQ